MLQQMFEVMATRFYEAMQTFAPLINSVVDDTLLQNGPLVKSAINSLLQTSPHLKSVTALPCKTLIFKNSIDRSTVTADQACACWRECDRSKWDGTKPISPTTNSSFSTLNSPIRCRTGHFLTVILVWSGTWLARLTKQKYNKVYLG